MPGAKDYTEEAEKPTASGGHRCVVHAGGSVAVVAHLDRRRAEALALELRALARRYGLQLLSTRVRPGDTRSEVTDAGSDSTQ